MGFLESTFTIHQVAAFLNGFWGGASSLVIVAALWPLVRGWSLTREGRALCVGTVISSVCVALHRLYWNVGIWTREEGRNYSLWAIEHRDALVVLVVGVAAGVAIAVHPYAVRIAGARWWWWYVAYLIVGGLLSAAFA